MKHYLDIENLRDEDIILNGEITRKRNDLGFRLDDIVVISEKTDGSCSSVSWDAYENRLRCFSHRQELAPDKTLNGFWNFANNLDVEIFKQHPNWIFFGEWTGCKNKIIYRQEAKGRWYVFNIYDAINEVWLPQQKALELCKKYGLDSVHVFYKGPFQGWDHVRTFMNQPQMGEIQEGVVIENMSELKRNITEGSKNVFKLKLVNTEFKESMIRQPKEVDPEVEAAKKNAEELLNQVVTKARVEKILIKLQQESEVLPRILEPKDMSLVAKNLPRAVYEDILKEEKEVLMACGEYGGKTCNQITMRIAKELILGV